ncbi:plasmid partitioning protein RepB [Pararhizobium sp. YC-54]|uniref:plasmid partitioning protein RepB n=1 Tax=Pararhizobium sp. YC-54 TaxID=2986920 RepID=UPI0021F7BAA7|nr:plasmid partitioning protein RepB [Pararhizobium sp. YC-54]MCW0002265.1 plasmid partitioning protein RepB [Pararhizobium sp. YC-54]
MARKDVFANITNADVAKPERKATPGYATRGASRSMISSLGELAEKAAKAEQILQGEAVVEIDPEEIDGSFVSDRLEDDELAFAQLLEAIRERGQDSPVLLRPHPDTEARYQVVFGHRRVRAAKLLSRTVRAVVKEVADVDHVIAQGQENSARENLSFIERAVFSQRLIDLGYQRPTIMLALSIDAPMLTRMLSVTGRVPARVSTAIGAAKNVGRDRWLELAQLIERPENRAKVDALVAEEQFKQSSSDDRFERILAELKKVKKAPKRLSQANTWTPDDGSVVAEYKNSGRGFSLSLRAKEAGKFGQFLSVNLERLFEEYRENEKQRGD